MANYPDDNPWSMRNSITVWLLVSRKLPINIWQIPFGGKLEQTEREKESSSVGVQSSSNGIWINFVNDYAEFCLCPRVSVCLSVGCHFLARPVCTASKRNLRLAGHPVACQFVRLSFIHIYHRDPALTDRQTHKPNPTGLWWLLLFFIPVSLYWLHGSWPLDKSH